MTAKAYKPTIDHDFGKDRREQECAYFNQVFDKNSISCVMKLRCSNLQVELINLDTLKRISIIFCYEKSGGVYLTIPRPQRSAPLHYISCLADDHYYMIVVSNESTDKIRKYSYPISMKLVMEKWTGEMGRGSNSHKFIYRGSFSKIEYEELETSFGLGTEQTLLQTLLDLVR